MRDAFLTVRRGEIVALIGPNGVGKSTPLRIIAGLEPADAGVVEVSASIGFVPRHGGLNPYLRPAEHFELFGCAGGRSNRVSRAEGRRLARELGWDASSASVVAELSGGTRQKLAVVLHALLSLVALARRRLTMLILVLLPVVFSQVVGDSVGRSLRAPVFGISWAVSTAAFFTTVAAREVEPRLKLAGWSTRVLAQAD